MKVKYGDIYVLRNPFVDGRLVPGTLQRLVDYNDRILKEGTEEERKTLIPVRYAMPIARFARKVNNEIVLLEEQVRELWKKYGTEQEGGGMGISPGENQLSFVREHEELMDMEVELDIDVRIKIPDNANIPMGDLMALDQFIEVVTV